MIHKQTHYLHERGLPDTGYRVSVWGETSAGEGPKTTRVVRTWPDRSRHCFIAMSIVVVDNRSLHGEENRIQ